MPPKNKKRVINVKAESKTLHHFFGGKPANSSKASNSSSSGPSTLAKTKNSEIIVIDDSDDEVEVVDGPHPHKISNKRRKLSPSKNTTTGLTTHLARPPNPSRQSTVIVGGSSSSMKTGFKVSFGSPVLLSDSPSHGIHSHSSEQALPLQFGEPMLLQLEEPSSKPSKTTGSDGNPFGGHHSPETEEVGFDEWLDGGDEVLYPPVQAEDTQVNKNETGGDILLEDDSYDTEMMQGHEDQTMLVISESEVSSLSTSVVPHQPALSESNAEHAAHNFENASNADSENLATITSRGDAFSKMMSSIKENTAWREASKTEKTRFARSNGSNGTRNKAPFYKVLQGMPIAVDAFKYGAIPGVTAYFLTHAHSDHYTNLSSSWKHGPIYCSEGTANLIIHMLSVDRKWVHALPLDKPVEIPDTQGVNVTLIEANHCPGSCLFFFEGRQTVDAGDSTFKSSHVGSTRIFRYLHCGDFRASPRHVLHPAVKGKEIDHVYLDTTYLDPRYTFPPQPLVINACAELAKRVVCNQPTSDKSSSMISWLLPNTKGKGKEQEQPPGKSLVVVGTYSIGKERIVKAIARSLNTKVYCDRKKAAILRCQVDSELDELLTADPKEALVHLVPLGTISIDQLKIYLERFKDTFDRVIGFRPTGWTYSQPAGTDQLPSIANIISKCSQKSYTYSDLQLSAKSTSTLQVYAVPYSEHSSFYELTCFAMSFNWNKMIATVNVGSENSRNKMNRWIHKWEAERKRAAVTDIVPYRHLDYW